MTRDPEQIRKEIHGKVVELARELGNDARKLQPGETIPSSGYLDSAGLMALIMWYEDRYGLSIEQDDLTIDNFGTIDAMTAYVERCGPR